MALLDQGSGGGSTDETDENDTTSSGPTPVPPEEDPTPDSDGGGSGDSTGDSGSGDGGGNDGPLAESPSGDTVDVSDSTEGGSSDSTSDGGSGTSGGGSSDGPLAEGPGGKTADVSGDGGGDGGSTDSDSIRDTINRLSGGRINAGGDGGGGDGANTPPGGGPKAEGPGGETADVGGVPDHLSSGEFITGSDSDSSSSSGSSSGDQDRDVTYGEQAGAGLTENEASVLIGRFAAQNSDLVKTGTDDPTGSIDIDDIGVRRTADGGLEYFLRGGSQPVSRDTPQLGTYETPQLAGETEESVPQLGTTETPGLATWDRSEAAREFSEGVAASDRQLFQAAAEAEQAGDINWTNLVVAAGGQFPTAFGLPAAQRRQSDPLEQDIDAFLGDLAASLRQRGAQFEQQQQQVAAESFQGPFAAGLSSADMSRAAGEFGEAAFNVAADLVQAPSGALELVETGEFLVEGYQHDATAEDVYQANLRAAAPALEALGVDVDRSALEESRLEQSEYERRLDVTAGLSEQAGAAAVREARQNPRDLAAELVVGFGAGAALGGASRVARAGRLARSVDAPDGSVSGGAPGGQSFVGDIVGSRRRVTNAFERGPDVDVVRDADAGLIDVDPMLWQQVRDAAPSRPSRPSNPLDTVLDMDPNEFVQDAARRAGRASRRAELEGTTAVRGGLLGARERLPSRSTFRDPSLGTRFETRYFEGAREAGRASRRFEQRVRDAPGEFYGGVREGVGDAVGGARDASLPSFDRPSVLDMDADQFVQDAARRAGRASRTAEIQGATALRGGLLGVRERVPNRPTFGGPSLGTRFETAVFAGAREAGRRYEGALRSTDATLAVLLNDLGGTPDAPSLSAPSVELLQARLGARSRGLWADARFAVGTARASASDRARGLFDAEFGFGGVGNPFEGITDTTIRVGPARPPRGPGFGDVDLGFDEGDLGPFADDTTGFDVGGGDGPFTPDAERDVTVDVGDGQQAFLRQEDRLDTPSTDMVPEGQGRPAGEAWGVAPFGAAAGAFGGAGLGFGGRFGLVNGFGPALAEDRGLGFGNQFGPVTINDTTPGLGQVFRQTPDDTLTPEEDTDRTPERVLTPETGLTPGFAVGGPFPPVGVPPKRPPGEPDADTRTPGGGGEGQAAGGGSLLNGALRPGWLSETVVSIATQSSVQRRAPSQAALEAQGGVGEFTGELPTQAMLTGSEKTRSDIRAVQDLFGGFGGGDADFGFGGGDDASGGSGFDESFVTGGGGGAGGGGSAWV